MTVAPEGLDSLGKTDDAGVVAAAAAAGGDEPESAEAGKDGEAKDGASGSVASAVSASPPAPAKPEVEDVSPVCASALCAATLVSGWTGRVVFVRGWWGVGVKEELCGDTRELEKAVVFAGI